MAREIISKLSEKQREAFESIDNGKILGATTHIKMIIDMIEDLSMNNDYSAKEKMEYIRELSRFFKDTRGNSSYAIVNALEYIEKSISEIEENIEIEAYVKSVIANYLKQSEDDMKIISELTGRVLEHAETIMLYDYSGTVEKAVCKINHPLKVIIPESRAIDGGKPFVKPVLKAGHKINFIPDVSILSVLKEVDAVLIGAETYYPDGTAFNTVGSDILAELCDTRHIPFYVLTPTLKCDKRSIHGIFKPVIYAELREKMTYNWDFNSSDVDFNSVELVSVDAKYITAYINEYGIISPNNIFNIKAGEKNESKSTCYDTATAASRKLLK